MTVTNTLVYYNMVKFMPCKVLQNMGLRFQTKKNILPAYIIKLVCSSLLITSALA
jgi:hypothetical protein